MANFNFDLNNLSNKIRTALNKNNNDNENIKEEKNDNLFSGLSLNFNKNELDDNDLYGGMISLSNKSETIFENEINKKSEIKDYEGTRNFDISSDLIYGDDDSVSGHILLTQKSNGKKHILPYMEGLNPAEIRNISSQVNGNINNQTLTVTTSNGTKYVFDMTSRTDGKNSYNYVLTASSNETITKNADGNYKAIRNYSGTQNFNISTERLINANGTIVSEQILLTQKSNGKIQSIPFVEGLNPAEIRNISSKVNENINNQTLTVTTSNGTKYVFDMTSRTDGKNSYNYVLTASSNETITKNADGNYKATKNYSGTQNFNISTERFFNANGTTVSEQILLTQKSNGKIQSIPFVEGLNPAEIRNISSKVNGNINNQTLTVTTSNGTKYVFNMTSRTDSKNTYKYSYTVNNGDSVTVCYDGNIKIKSSDGNTITKYDNNGNVIYSMNKEDAVTYLNNKKIYIRKYTDKAELTDRLFEDVDIVRTAEYMASKVGVKDSSAYKAAYSDSVKSQMIATESNMKNEIGEIIEKSDGLYVNDGNGLVKLGISAETYLNLFPPIERYAINQGGIGDCYFISGCLIDMMKNKKAFSQLIQMFSENENGDISIEFAGTLNSPVLFEKGELKIIDGIADGRPVTQYVQSSGAKGIKMIEQAYAISRFAKESSQEISSIDIDEAIPTIIGGFQSYVYKEILGIPILKIPTQSEINHFIQITRDNKDFIDNNETDFINIIRLNNEILKITERINKISDVFRINDFNTINLNLKDMVKDSITNIDKFKEFVSELNEPFLDFSKSTLSISDDKLENIINIINSSDYLDLINNLNNLEYESGIFAENWDILWMLTEPMYDEKDISEIIQNGFYNSILKILENMDIKHKIDKYSKDINDENILLSFNSHRDIPEYNIVSAHAHSIEKIDTENELIYITNPWVGGSTIPVPYEVFVECDFGYDIGYLDETVS